MLDATRKPIRGVKFQPVGRPSKTSADGYDCESALGGRADTLLAGKAEWTAKIAMERQTRGLACCR